MPQPEVKRDSRPLEIIQKDLGIPEQDLGKLKQVARTDSRPLEIIKGSLGITEPDTLPLADAVKLRPGEKGLLDLIDNDPNRDWSMEEVSLVKEVADQLSLALENANLFQQTQDALAETDALYQASADLNAANTYADVIQVLHKHTIAGRYSTLTSINFFDYPWTEMQDPDWVEVVYRYTESLRPNLRQFYRLDNTPGLVNILNKERATIIENAHTDERLTGETRQMITHVFGAESVIIVPIVAGGVWHGFIDVYYSAPVSFTVMDIRRLTNLSNQASEKVVSIQLNQAEDARRLNADRLATVARRMAELVSEEELIQLTISTITDIYQPDQLNLLLWNQNAHQFQLNRKLLSIPDKAEDSYRLYDHVSPQERLDLKDVYENNRSSYIVEERHENLIYEHAMFPWLVGDEVIGIIEIYNTSYNPILTEASRDLINSVILQAATAIDRARLFEQTQTALALTDEQARRLRLLNEMTEQLSQTTQSKDAYQIAVEKTAQIFQADRVSLGFLAPEKSHFDIVAAKDVSGHIFPGTTIPCKDSPYQVAMDRNRVLRSEENPELKTGALHSFIIGPLSIAGQPIGILDVSSYSPNVFSQIDEDFMVQLLTTLSTILDNQRLFITTQEALADSEEQGRRLNLLNEMSDRITQAGTPQQIYDIALDYTAKMLKADRVSIAMLTSDHSKMEVVGVAGQEHGLVKGAWIDMNDSYQSAIAGDRIISDPFVEFPDGTHHTSIVAPLTIGNQTAGVIDAFLKPGVVSQRDENVMQQIASSLSGVLDNNRLFNQIRRRSIQLETAAEVSRVASTLLDTAELFPRVVELIKDGFNLQFCGLYLSDNDGRLTGESGKWAVLQAGTGETGRIMLERKHKLEIGANSMVGKAIATGEASVALERAQKTTYGYTANLPEAHSEIALPMTSRGRVLGALSIQSERESAWTSEDITALKTMSDQLANAIENAQLFEQTEKRAEELLVMNEMARAFTQTLDVDVITEACYQYTSRLMKADNFQLVLFDADREEIEYKVYVEDQTPTTLPEPVKKGNTSLMDWIITQARPILMADQVQSSVLKMGLELPERSPMSWLGVPMLSGNRVIGVIMVHDYSTPRTFSDHELELLGAVANQTAIAIDNARLFYQEQARAEQERLVRTITDKVRRGSNAKQIMRIALEELSQVLDAEEAVLQLGTRQQLINLGKSGTQQPLRSDNDGRDIDGA